MRLMGVRHRRVDERKTAHLGQQLSINLPDLSAQNVSTASSRKTLLSKSEKK